MPSTALYILYTVSLILAQRNAFPPPNQAALTFPVTAIILETAINCSVLIKLRNIFQLKTNYKQSFEPKPEALTLQ